MFHENTLDIVRQIMEKLAAVMIGVSWPSSHNLASPSTRPSSRRGPGYEYAGQKIFDPTDGDDARHIDYNLSAAEAEEDVYVVRTFTRPRLVAVNVFLDVSRSMNVGIKGTLKSLLAAICAGCGIQSAMKTKDFVSFVTFAAQPLSILKECRATIQLLMRALIKAVEDREGGSLHENVEAETQDEGGGLALALAAAPQAKRTIFMVVSDFVNMNEDDWEALRLIGIQHDLIALFVQDRRERELPEVPWPGMHYTVEDVRGKSISLWIAPSHSSNLALRALRKMFGSVMTREEYRQNFKRHESAILARLEDCRANTLIVSTDEEDDAVRDLLALLASKLRR